MLSYSSQCALVFSSFEVSAEIKRRSTFPAKQLYEIRPWTVCVWPGSKTLIFPASLAVKTILEVNSMNPRYAFVTLHAWFVESWRGNIPIINHKSSTVNHNSSTFTDCTGNEWNWDYILLINVIEKKLKTALSKWAPQRPCNVSPKFGLVAPSKGSQIPSLSNIRSLC